MTLDQYNRVREIKRNVEAAADQLASLMVEVGRVDFALVDKVREIAEKIQEYA